MSNNKTKKRKIKKINITKSFFQKIFENVSDVVMIVDITGKIIYQSPNIENFFGWAQEEMIDKSISDFVHLGDRFPTMDIFKSVLETPGKKEVQECRIRNKDNTYKWVRGVAVNLLDDPEIKGILICYHDINKYKETENELRDSQERFKALHEASFGGIVIHDRGLIIECNKGLSQITGYTHEELIGMDGLILIKKSYQDIVMHNINSKYEKPYEVIGVRKDGSEYPLRLQASNIPYKGKNVRTVEFRDITLQKRAELESVNLQKQLIQSQKMESIGRLAGGVAHDFNNMLSVIHGRAEMALKELEKTGTASPDMTDAIEKDLKEILHASGRSIELTKALLGYARKQVIKPVEMDLNLKVEQMITMLSRIIGEDIELLWLPCKNPCNVKLDSSQLDQILVNLCVNARDAIYSSSDSDDHSGYSQADLKNPKIWDYSFNYSDAGIDGDIRFENIENYTGRIIIRTALKQNCVLLSVSDNGCGMSKEEQKNLFEPFYTTKKKGKGTGLGLATIYGIIHQNKGNIKVKSSLSRGTEFKIYFPKSSMNFLSDDSDLPEKISTHSERETSNITIMLVEDEPSVLKITARMLRKNGFNVIAAGSGMAALELEKKHEDKIDLVITDVIMPGINGKELNERLMKIRPDLKFIFMSGYSDDVIGDQGILEETLNFLQKPFDLNTLLEKIDETLYKNSH